MSCLSRENSAIISSNQEAITTRQASRKQLKTTDNIDKLDVLTGLILSANEFMASINLAKRIADFGAHKRTILAGQFSHPGT
jgi:hypothetical protein